MTLSHRQERSPFEAFWGLGDRDWTRSGLTLAEGPLLARRLLESGLVPEGVLCLAEHAPAFTALAGDRCPVTVLTQNDLERWAGYAFHRGVLAVGRRPPALGLEAALARGPGLRRLAVAPRLTDPENLGSIFRSALGLGWDAVAIGPSSTDPYSRRCAKVSMGAVYAVPPVSLPADHEVTRRLLAEGGWTSLALSLEDGALPLEDWWASAAGRQARGGRLALWVGNELSGLDPADRACCDLALVLPMARGHDSLNAAVAAGIALSRLTT